MRDRVVTLTIPGDPIAKARARIRYGFQKRFYDIQHLEKSRCQMFLSSQFNNNGFFEGPCDMDMTFYMPIKKSHRVIEGSFHSYRPDCDNLEKWIMDLFNGIIYKDDCIISTLSCRKIYSYNPRTVIIIKELPYAETEKSKKIKERDDFLRPI